MFRRRNVALGASIAVYAWQITLQRDSGLKGLVSMDYRFLDELAIVAVRQCAPVVLTPPCMPPHLHTPCKMLLGNGAAAWHIECFSVSVAARRATTQPSLEDQVLGCVALATPASTDNVRTKCFPAHHHEELRLELHQEQKQSETNSYFWKNSRILVYRFHILCGSS